MTRRARRGDRLAEDNLVLDLLVEPLDVGLVAESVEAALDEGDGDVKVRQGNLRGVLLSIALKVFDRSVVELGEALGLDVLHEVHKRLVA